MYLEQFYVEPLGHYSYLIGSIEAGSAFVVDPKRDIADYLAAAGAHGLRITSILETHLHNDYISGSRELAAATGATICHSAAAALAYDHHPLHEGDTLTFGELAVRVLETPGHTPEHLCYVVCDTSRSPDLPVLILSGGDLLVGSVGRPDLLGPEWGRRLAPQLYDSLHDKILQVGDSVTVLPTHGAGSSCGAAISTTRTSTVGYEKATNPYLQQPTREAFVAAVLHGQPTVPAYYPRMRPLNQSGPPIRGTVPPARVLAPEEFAAQVAATGGLVLDTSPPFAFGGAHIPGSVNVGLGSNFTTWAGSVLPPGVPLFLVPAAASDVEEIVRQLFRIGYEDIGGYLRGGIFAWAEGGRPVATLPQVSVHALKTRLDGGERLQVVDVRKDDEWQGGHIANALHLLANDVATRSDTVPRDRTLAVICGAGYRSSIAASLLQRAGFPEVLNVVGGMSAWNAAHFPTLRGETPVAPSP